MELRSRNDHLQDGARVLDAQLRDSFGRVTYSHKTQEKCADTLLYWSSLIKAAQILLSALSSVSIISTFFGVGIVGSIAGAILTAALCGLSLLTKESDLGELAHKHRLAASDMWFIRERYLSLITDLNIGNKALETIQEDRDTLVSELRGIYSAAPSTNSRAYRKAQQALKYSEEMTFTDDEIDAFLPNELKKRRECKRSA